MSKYNITFERETIEQISFEIEAKNRQEAMKLAWQKVGNGFDHDWEQTDYVGNPMYVCCEPTK